MNDELKKFIELTIDQKMASMSNLAIPNHAHNSYDSNQLDPAVSLLGFPVNQVSSSASAPTDLQQNGTFRFQIDTTGTAYLWAYLNYNTAGVITGVWKGIRFGTGPTGATGSTGPTGPTGATGPTGP